VTTSFKARDFFYAIWPLKDVKQCDNMAHGIMGKVQAPAWPAGDAYLVPAVLSELIF
jgi:hypothetical protein